MGFFDDIFKDAKRIYHDAHFERLFHKQKNFGKAWQNTFDWLGDRFEQFKQERGHTLDWIEKNVPYGSDLINDPVISNFGNLPLTGKPGAPEAGAFSIRDIVEASDLPVTIFYELPAYLIAGEPEKAGKTGAREAQKQLRIVVRVGDRVFVGDVLKSDEQKTVWKTIKQTDQGQYLYGKSLGEDWYNNDMYDFTQPMEDYPSTGGIRNYHPEAYVPAKIVAPKEVAVQ